jgi:hypothetical protein
MGSAVAVRVYGVNEADVCHARSRSSDRYCVCVFLILQVVLFLWVLCGYRIFLSLPEGNCTVIARSGGLRGRVLARDIKTRRFGVLGAKNAGASVRAFEHLIADASPSGSRVISRRESPTRWLTWWLAMAFSRRRTRATSRIVAREAGWRQTCTRRNPRQGVFVVTNSSRSRRCVLGFDSAVWTFVVWVWIGLLWLVLLLLRMLVLLLLLLLILLLMRLVLLMLLLWLLLLLKL